MCIRDSFQSDHEYEESGAVSTEPHQRRSTRASGMDGTYFSRMGAVSYTHLTLPTIP
ncbi:hypothetical protein H8G93_18655, partial [Bacillus pumilus]|nr:hypothetical protein [Bacillus pumilus]